MYIMKKTLALLCLVISVSVQAADVAFSQALSAAKARVQAKPNDAKARYALGRILLIGYVSEYETINAEIDEMENVVKFPSDSAIQVKRMNGSPNETEATYLRDAVLHLNKATRFDANAPLYAIANAWAFEQLAMNWTTVMGDESLGDIASQKDAWAKVAAENRRAYSMAKDQDVAARSSRERGPNAFPSLMAAQNLLRLRTSGKARVTNAEAQRLANHARKFGN